MVFNKHFYRNIWNTEEDLLANYKNIYKDNLSYFTVKTYPNYELAIKNKASKLWLIGEQFNENEYLVEEFSQRQRIEREMPSWTVNYSELDIFTSFLLNKFKSTERWGVEIGMPYFALSSHLSPVSIKNITYLMILIKKAAQGEWFENMPSGYELNRIRYASLHKREKLYLYQIGNSEAFRKAYAYLYKFGMREEHLDAVAFNPFTFLSAEHLDDYLRIVDFSRLSRLLWVLDKHSQTQERLQERMARWDRLCLLKNKKYEDQKRRWGITTFIIKLLIFLKSYDRTIK